MIKEDFFNYFYIYLEEQCEGSVVATQLEKDDVYQKALAEEHALYEQYKALDLTDEQRAIIDQWGDSVQATNAAYSMAVFRLGMQSCFSLMMRLAGLPCV